MSSWRSIQLEPSLWTLLWTLSTKLGMMNPFALRRGD